jgi:hypothetical protein
MEAGDEGCHRNRTQEVAGSSPASSTHERPANAGLSVVYAEIVEGVWSSLGQIKSYNAPATWSDLSGHLSPATPASFVNGVSKTRATVANPFRADKITIASGGKSKQSGPFDVRAP